MNQLYKQCPNCNAWNDESANYCHRCGTPLMYTARNNNFHTPNQGGFSPAFNMNDCFAVSPNGCSRGVTALLAIFLGSLGIHYFYLGKSTAGLVCLLVTVLSCTFLAPLVALVTLAQGIYMFTITNYQFYDKYENNLDTFPLF